MVRKCYENEKGKMANISIESSTMEIKKENQTSRRVDGRNNKPNAG